MKRISEEGLKVLENCCNFACEVYEDKSKFSRSHIFEEIKNGLKFRRRYKVEDNFAYVYNEVFSFGKALEGRVKVLCQSKEIYPEWNNTYLRYVKHYKLLIDNTHIIKLDLTQTLKQVYLRNTDDVFKFDFELPVFICKSMLVSLVQNGIENMLMQNHYDIDNMNYIDSSVFKNISKFLHVHIKDYHNQKSVLEIYYDENLVLKEANVDAKERIVEFLNKQLALGNITSDDLKFKKKISRFEEKDNINTCIYTNFVNEHDKNHIYESVFSVNTKVNKLVCKLTNNSKIKIIVTKFESNLHNKKMGLYYFIKKVLKPNFGDLCIKLMSEIFCGKMTHFYTKSGFLLQKDTTFDMLRSINFSIEKYNELFLPEKYIFENKSFKSTILTEFIEKNGEDGKFYLTQYLCFEKGRRAKIILKLVYQMKSANFSFRQGKIENIIIPSIVYGKSCAIFLDKDFDLENITPDEICIMCNPYITITNESIVESIIKQVLPNEIYTSCACAESCEIFKEEKEITFLKKKKLTYFNLSIGKKYNDKLAEEQVNALFEHYNDKKINN